VTSSPYFTEHVSDIMDSVDHDASKYNLSHSATANNGNSASSSKAVLAALRALQDKIRRLESERGQALDECTQLRHTLQTQEVEFENAKKRESLLTSKSVADTRHELERVLSDKTELEIRLAKLEEKNRESRDQVDDLKKRIVILEEEKYQATMQLKDFESDQHRLEHQIDLQHRKENGKWPY
jgi:chromosome segregation ATPase